MQILADLFRAKIEAVRLIDDADKTMKAAEDDPGGKNS
jgi:hypothetical protein